MAGEDTLAFDLLVRDKGAERTLNRVGDAAVSTGKDFDKAAGGAGHLSAQITETERRIKELTEEFDRTGDRGLWKELRKEKSALSTLTQMSQQATKLGLALGNAGKEGVAAGFNATKMFGPEVQGAIVVGIVAAAVAAAPLVGATIAGGITAAVGGGVLAAGIAAAARDPRVEAAFGDLTATATAVFENLGTPFVQPTVRALGILRSELGRMRGEATGMGADMAIAVEPLAKGIAGFAEKILPGIRALTREAGPMLATLAKELPDLGEAAADMFANFAKGADGGGEALEALLRGLGVAMMSAGLTVRYLAAAFKILDDVWTALGPAGTAFWFLFADPQVKRIKGAASATDDMADSAEELLQQIKDLSQAYSDWLDLNLDAEEAAANFKLSLIDAGREIKENHGKLDSHSEAGLRNQQIVRGLIREANNQREAEIARAGATEEAVARANKAYSANILKIIDVGVKAGASRKELEKMAGRYNVELYFKMDAIRNQLRTLAYAFSNIPLPGMGQISAGFNIAQAIIASALMRRHGGISYARNGLLNLSGQAAVFSDGPPIFGFAERGTGGEAFVAHNAPRGRSLAIGAEAMAWHGAAVVPYEQMGRQSVGVTHATLSYAGPTTGLDGVFSTWVHEQIRTGRIRLEVRSGQSRVSVA